MNIATEFARIRDTVKSTRLKIVADPKRQGGTNMDAKPLITGVSKPVSQIALGTAFYSIDSKEKWFELLDEYVNFGGAILDTARGYGVSENVLGLWMEARSTRHQIIIQTKCGLTGADGYLPAQNFPEVVREEITTSLQALRTDYTDVLLPHRDNQEMPVAGILAPLNNELANGRIHAFGASNWEYRRLTEANGRVLYRSIHSLDE